MAAIAFIGLGQMGSPMASNLLQQGHQLRVFDVNAEEYDATGLSGFVVMKLGRVPQVGDSIEFKNLTITVKKTEHMKISECEVTVSPREDNEEEE